MSTCILLMTKAPRVGAVKSRLASELGEVHSAGLYMAFLLDILETLRSIGAPFIVYFTPENAIDELRAHLGDDVQYFPQRGADLGERLYNGMLLAEELGYRCAVALASDVPDISVEYLMECVQALDQCSSVIGPSIDGGYNLIGLNLEYLDRRVFTDITWGTDTVYSETMEKLAYLDPFILEPMRDIDTFADLEEISLKPNSHTMRYLREIRQARD